MKDDKTITLAYTDKIIPRMKPINNFVGLQNKLITYSYVSYFIFSKTFFLFL